ncbi:MAG: hypothetical protein AAF562_01505, partial [Pseudomonadota bacterium]
DILTVIESHLTEQSIPPSKFGRALCNDPRLVFDLRKGRKLRGPLRDYVLHHIGCGTNSDHFLLNQRKGK